MKASQKQFKPQPAANRLQRFAGILGQVLLFLLLSFFAVRFMVEGSPTMSIMVIAVILYMTWNLYRKNRKEP
jgi:hypothetical protein